MILTSNGREIIIISSPNKSNKTINKIFEKSLGINNKVDLYKRVTPALNCKSRELSKKGITIKKEEIWNYLIRKRWNAIKELELSQIVDDILNLDNNSLIEFAKTKNNNTVDLG